MDTHEHCVQTREPAWCKCPARFADGFRCALEQPSVVLRLARQAFTRLCTSHFLHEVSQAYVCSRALARNEITFTMPPREAEFFGTGSTRFLPCPRAHSERARTVSDSERSPVRRNMCSSRESTVFCQYLERGYVGCWLRAWGNAATPAAFCREGRHLKHLSSLHDPLQMQADASVRYIVWFGRLSGWG